jgi:hypothetical protein
MKNVILYFLLIQNKVNNMSYTFTGKDYWIGMTDETIEGVWRWYGTGTNVRFTDWAPTEPQDNGHGEDCAVFHHSLKYQWADVPCASNRNPLCEKYKI